MAEEEVDETEVQQDDEPETKRSRVVNAEAVMELPAHECGKGQLQFVDVSGLGRTIQLL